MKRTPLIWESGRPTRSLLLTAILLFTSTAASPARAEEAPIRFAIVLDEVVDGELRPESDVEAAVLDELSTSEGLILVDPEQAQKVRLAVHGSSLLEAEVSDLVTSLDADYLLVGEIRFERNSTDGLGFAVHSYTARGRTRLIAVDSAQILGAPRPTANAFHPNSAEAALFRTATQCGSDLAEKALALLEARPLARTELFVDASTRLDPALVQETVACLSDHTGNPARLVVQHERGLTIELSTSRPATEIARDFGPQGLCGLSLRASSRHALRATYRPPIQIPISAAAFQGSDSLEARDRWLTREIPKMVLADLSDQSFLEVAPELALAAKLPAGRQGALGLAGSLQRSGDELRIQARVIALYRRRPLVSEQVTCPNEAVGPCVAELTRAISSRLQPAIVENRHLIPVGKKVAVRATREALVISKVDVPDLFPARVGYYDRHPIGTLRIENTSDEQISNVVVNASLERLSREARVSDDAITVDANASIDLPFRIALDPDRLRTHDQNATRVISIQLEYRRGDFRYELRRSVPVMVYSRNALDWRRTSSVAAFVTSDNRTVSRIATEIRSRLAGDLREDPLAVPVAAFRALDDSSYAPDRVNPFRPDELDSVQYPVETLHRGTGDCDDVAVAYAALLEACAVPALLIQTPGHVLVGVGTDVSPSNRRILHPDENATFVYRGRSWIPVETTRIGATFSEAWTAGAENLRRHRGDRNELGVTEVRSAWRTYPPADLAPELDVSVGGVDVDAIRAELQTMRTAREEQMSALLERLEASTDPADLNRLGVILGQRGRLEESRAAFEDSLSRRRNPSALANLASTRLIEGSTRVALEGYEASLSMDGGHIEVRLNAILASHLLAQTDERFVERRAVHVSEAVAADPDRLEQFFRRISSGDLTGSDDRRVSLASLATVVEAALVDRGRSPRDRTTATEGGAPGLVDWINWLE